MTRERRERNETGSAIDARRLPHARKAALPPFIRPQLATLVEEAPPGDDWLHEIKLDGYRALCRVEKGRAFFFTREGNDWTERFKSLAGGAARLRLRQGLLDGEVVVILEDGSTNFQALQNALSGDQSERLVYFAFDLLHLDGYDLTQTPLIERKRALAGVLEYGKNAKIRYSDHVVGQGEAFYQHACRLGLEGIVSKRKEAPYRPGRGRDWLKVKCLLNQEFVIGGFTDPEGSRVGFGALLVGVYDEGNMIYAGRVGTGFTGRSLRQLRARLDKIERDSPPFSNPPTGAAARGVHWVAPKLVAAVNFTSWTRDGILRHPSFQGLREDKKATAVTRERPLPMDAATDKKDDHAEVAGARLTHPDRVLYPDQGITKRELALYYESIADWILPHLQNRPLSVVRCPEGHTRACFYQRHVKEPYPDGVRGVPAREKGSTKSYVSVNSLRGLIALVQMGVLELHTWGCRADLLDRPDRLIFDLDPDPAVAWDDVIDAARKVRRQLADLGLSAFVKTTGGKGLHVVVPVARKQNWEEVKEFSRAVAETIVRGAPDRYVATMSKAKRKGKIFIDYLRNSWGATAIAAYSTRARPGAPVSAPLDWDELCPKIRPDRFNVRNILQRLAELKNDPWRNYEASRRPITAAMKKRLAQQMA